MRSVIWLVVTAVVIFVGVWLTSQAPNVKEYNRHMCVEVYGLNEQCESLDK